MTFGEKLKLLRSETGKTQEEICDDIKKKYENDVISLSSLKKYEGGGIPDLNKLKAISKYYKVSYDYLLNDECNTRNITNLEIVNNLGITEKTVESIRTLKETNFVEELLINTYRDSLLKWLEEKSQLKLTINYSINKFCRRLYKTRQYNIPTDTMKLSMQKLIDFLEHDKIKQNYWNYITNTNEYKGFINDLRYIKKSWDNKVDAQDKILEYFNIKTFDNICELLMDYETICDVEFKKILNDFCNSYEENNINKI